MEGEEIVLHTGHPLLHQIIESFNDPDPDRALRPRPFVYGSVRHRLAAEGVTVPRASEGPGRRVVIISNLLNAVRRIVVRARVESAPVCEPACCS
jgi:hypothetical protein